MGYFYPPPPPIVTATGSQPYAKGKIPPSILDVPVNNPPFGLPSPELPEILYQWQPPDWWGRPFIGGNQPMHGRKPTARDRVDDPAFQHRGKTIVAVSMAAAAWQPPDWQKWIFTGGRQPFAPVNVSPDAEAVPVNDPPYQHRGKTVVTAAMSATAWQPPEWHRWIFIGGGQPFAPLRMAAGIPGQSINDPPYQTGERSAAQRSILVTLNQPPDWWRTPFTGNLQPMVGRKLPPQITDVEVDNPPFGIPNPQIPELLSQWQPPIWWLTPFVSRSGSQPLAQNKLPPSVVALLQNNPPFGHRGRKPETIGTIFASQPPEWWFRPQLYQPHYHQYKAFQMRTRIYIII